MSAACGRERETGLERSEGQWELPARSGLGSFQCYPCSSTTTV